MADDSGMYGADPGNMMDTFQLQQLMDALGSTGADAEKRANISQQMELAQMLRGGANMPSGRFIPGMHGGVYVAPSPFQDAAALLNQYAGMKGMQGAVGEGQKLTESEAMARQKTMAAVLAMMDRAPLQGVNPVIGQDPNVQISGGGAGTPGGNTAPAPVAPAAPSPSAPAAGTMTNPNAASVFPPHPGMQGYTMPDSALPPGMAGAQSQPPIPAQVAPTDVTADDFWQLGAGG